MPTSIGTMSSPRLLAQRRLLEQQSDDAAHLEELQVALRLPVGDVARVFGPFHALQRDELVRELRAQPALHHFVLLQRVDGFEQVLRQQA